METLWTREAFRAGFDIRVPIDWALCLALSQASSENRLSQGFIAEVADWAEFYFDIVTV